MVPKCARGCNCCLRIEVRFLRCLFDSVLSLSERRTLRGEVMGFYLRFQKKKTQQQYVAHYPLLRSHPIIELCRVGHVHHLAKSFAISLAKILTRGRGECFTTTCRYRVIKRSHSCLKHSVCSVGSSFPADKWQSLEQMFFPAAFSDLTFIFCPKPSLHSRPPTHPGWVTV